jgi:hypothetical protein
MSEKETKLGRIAWRDLTVDDAEDLRDFYARVVGWNPVGCDMGGYEDYNMTVPDTGEAIAGVCHARGPKAPPQWIVYVTVTDVEASARRAVELGGEVLDGPRGMGDRTFCVIRDPAGAVMGLITP